MKKYLTILFILPAFLIAPSAMAASLLSPGQGGQLTPGLWIPNSSSSTITPNPNSLQVPCANIVGGCVSAGATTTVNSASGSVTIQGVAGTSVNTSGTTITVSSTVGLNPTLNLADVASTTAALNTLGGVPVGGNTTFAGVHYFPNPVQLAAGALCGVTTGVTDVGNCVNDIYAADAGNVSTTKILFPPGIYASSSFTNHIVAGNLGQKMQLIGVSGQGTTLNFGGGTNISAIVCDYGPGPNASGTSIQQVWNVLAQDITLIGNDQSVSDAQVGIKAGINNGCGHTMIDSMNIRNFGIGLYTATNTYFFAADFSIIKSNGRNIDVNNQFNAGESDEFFDDWIVDPANASSSKCAYFENSGTEASNFYGGSLDDCQLYVDGGNIFVGLYGTSFENPTHSTYGSYDYIVDNAGTNGQVVLSGVQMMNDATSTAAGQPVEFVKVTASSGFTANGVTLSQNGAAGTVTNFVSAGANAILNINGVVQNGAAIAGLVNGSATDTSEFHQLSNGLPVVVGPDRSA